MIVINGQGLGSSPMVMLGAFRFPTVSATGTQIVAGFPAGMPISSFTPGTYFLILPYANQLPSVFTLSLGTGGLASSFAGFTCPDGKLIKQFTGTGPPVCSTPMTDTGGDGIPDALDACPTVAKVSCGCLSYCPGTLYDLVRGNVPPGFNLVMTKLAVDADI